MIKHSDVWELWIEQFGSVLESSRAWSTSCSPNIGFDMHSYIDAFIGFAVFASYISLCCVRSLSLANADIITEKFFPRDKQKRLSSTLAKYTSLELMWDGGILPRNDQQSKFRVETTTSLACIHPLELSARNDFGISSRGSYGREYQERIGKWIISTYNSPFFLVVKILQYFYVLQ